MNIEQLIAANTAAIEANTAVLLRILERSEGTTEAPAAATPKAEKPAAKPKLTVVTPKAEETPEPDADEEEEALSHEILVKRVQDKFDSTEGAELNAAKKAFKELREKFEVKTIKDLTEDQFAEFAAGIAAL